MGSNTSWVGKKPLRRLRGLSDALSIAADPSFSVVPPLAQEELQNSSGRGEKGDDLLRILQELTTVQRKIVDLQLELQGKTGHTYICSCTIFLRPSSGAKLVLKKWLEELEAQSWSKAKKANDQPAFNWALNKTAGRWISIFNHKQHFLPGDYISRIQHG